MTRLIPPVLFLLLLLCLMPLSLLHPDSLVMRADAAMPWDIPIALGLTALFWGSWHFKRKKAEIHTFRQPQDLITDGPFRYSRNPMYLGFFPAARGSRLLRQHLVRACCAAGFSSDRNVLVHPARGTPDAGRLRCRIR